MLVKPNDSSLRHERTSEARLRTRPRYPVHPINGSDESPIKGGRKQELRLMPDFDLPSRLSMSRG